jgi:hypothetical protein
MRPREPGDPPASCLVMLVRHCHGMYNNVIHTYPGGFVFRKSRISEPFFFGNTLAGISFSRLWAFSTFRDPWASKMLANAAMHLLILGILCALLPRCRVGASGHTSHDTILTHLSRIRHPPGIAPSPAAWVPFSTAMKARSYIYSRILRGGEGESAEETQNSSAQQGIAGGQEPSDVSIACKDPLQASIDASRSRSQERPLDYHNVHPCLLSPYPFLSLSLSLSLSICLSLSLSLSLSPLLIPPPPPPLSYKRHTVLSSHLL